MNHNEILSYFREGWATCPSGHFIRGFHRGGSHQLRSIQWATCCKPGLHPHRYPECYDQNVGDGVTWECNRQDFYVVGIHRGASESLSSINKLRCCSMYNGMYTAQREMKMPFFTLLKKLLQQISRMNSTSLPRFDSGQAVQE